MGILQFSSCDKAGDPPPPALNRPLDLSPVFYSEKVEVQPYSYVDLKTQRFYRVRGDSSIIDIIKAISNNVELLPFDTVSDSPTLRWKRTESKIVYAGIFEDRIETDGHRITNPDKIVWAWHSALSSETDVTFENGREVVDAVIRYDLPAKPLINNRVYFWAAWAWDDQGLEVVYSTGEQAFVVEKD